MTSDENPADAIEPWFPLHDDDPSIGNGDRWTPCVETPGACPTLSIWFATEQQCEQWITAHLLADPAALEAAHRKGFYEGADSVIREELADPADRDERRNEAYRAQLARADRAEAEVARLRKLVEELGGTA